MSARCRAAQSPCCQHQSPLYTGGSTASSSISSCQLSVLGRGSLRLSATSTNLCQLAAGWNLDKRVFLAVLGKPRSAMAQHVSASKKRRASVCAYHNFEVAFPAFLLELGLQFRDDDVLLYVLVDVVGCRGWHVQLCRGRITGFYRRRWMRGEFKTISPARLYLVSINPTSQPWGCLVHWVALHT